MEQKIIAIRKAKLAKAHSESTDFLVKQIIKLETGLKPGDKIYDTAVDLMRDAQFLTQKIDRLITMINEGK